MNVITLYVIPAHHNMVCFCLQCMVKQVFVAVKKKLQLSTGTLL